MYRVAEFREPCVECGRDAPARCPRCGDPCCAAHVYSDDGLCEECETEFLRRAAVAGPGLRSAVIGLGLVAAIGAGAAGGGLLVALLGGAGAGFTSALAHLCHARRRRRYISEKRQGRVALNVAVT
jgi:hypothetical protein